MPSELRQDFTLRATRSYQAQPPLVALGSRSRLRSRLESLRPCAAGLAAFSAVFALPVIGAAALGLPNIVGIAAWAANIVLVVVLVRTAPPSLYRPVPRSQGASHEPTGFGALYAYRELMSDGDGGGDGGG